MTQNEKLQKIAFFIQLSLENTQKLEEGRINLANHELFHPDVSFKRFDQQQRGYLNLSDIQEFLCDNKIELEGSQIRFLFNQMDQNKVGRISYANFAKFILPHTNLPLREKAIRRESYIIKPNQLMPYEIEWGISRIFQIEVECQKNLNLAQKEIDWRELAILQNSLGAKDFVDASKQIHLFHYFELKTILMIFNDYFTYKSLSEKIPFELFINSLLKEQKIMPRNKFFDINSEDIHLIRSTLSKIREDITNERKVLKESSVDSINRKSNIDRSKSSQIQRNNQQDKLIQLLKANELKIDESNKVLTKSQLINLSSKNQSYQNSSKKPFSAAQEINSVLINTPQLSDSKTQRPKQEFDFYSKYGKLVISLTQEDQKLAVELQGLIKIIQQLEKEKSKLAQNNDFHPASAFHSMDIDGDGLVTKQDFEIFCKTISLNHSREDVQLVFEQITPYSAVMTYKSFLLSIVPQEVKYKEMMLQKKYTQNSSDCLDHFKAYMKIYFETVAASDYIRQKLWNTPGLDLQKVYNSIDQQDNSINFNQISEYLKNCKLTVSDCEVENLSGYYSKTTRSVKEYNDCITRITPKKI